MIHLFIACIALCTGPNLQTKTQVDESAISRKLLATFIARKSPKNKYQSGVVAAIRRFNYEAARKVVSASSTSSGPSHHLSSVIHNVPYISPEVRAAEAQQSKIDEESFERYASTLHYFNLEKTKQVILQELDSRSISIPTRGEHLVNLALIDMRLGNLAEAAKEMEAALPICPNYLAPHDGAALLYYTIIKGQQGIFYPGQEDYLNLKFKKVHENYFAKPISGDPSYRRYLNISDRHKSVMFKSYLLLADGVGGNETIQIKAYCAEKAVELEPNNAAALLAYGYTHGRGIPLVVTRLAAIEERLPAGDFKDYLDEYLSPGSTANRPKTPKP